jgi:sialidase-1
VLGQRFWVAGAVAVTCSALLAACTPADRQNAAFLLPAAPEVSYARNGSRVLGASELLTDNVVFPVTGSENPRIPVGLRATNGDIVAVASIRMGSISDTSSWKTLRAAISSDGGRTWEYHPVTTNTSGSEGDPAGVVDPAAGRITVFGQQRYTSDDHGRTWTARPKVVEPNAAGARGIPNGPGAGIALRRGPHAGRLVVMCRVSPPDSVINPFRLPVAWVDWSSSTNCVLYSDDGGETWRTSQTVQTSVGEGAVVELAGGALYMSSRTYRFDGRRSEAFSYDGGETWVDLKRSVLPEPYFGVNGSLTRVERPGGEDVVVYSNIPEWTAPLGLVPVVRKDLSLYVSTDEARSWRFGAVLRKGPAAYSSLIPLGDDIGVLYEAVVEGINSDRTPADPPDGIRFARVPIDRLLDPAAAGR